MKFKIEATNLIGVCKRAMGYIAKRNANSYTSMFMLETVDDGLIIRATNGNAFIKCFTPVEVLETGSLAIPADKFTGIISKINGMVECSSVKIKNKLEKFSIEATAEDGAKTRANLQAITSDSYPEDQLLPEEKWHEINAETFTAALKNIVPITAKDNDTSNRGIVKQSIHMEYKDDRLSIVATNGKSLGLEVIETMEPMDDFASIDLPGSYVDQILPLMKDQETVEVGVDGGKFFLKNNDSVSFITLFNTNYPHWTKVIPESYTYKTTVDCKKLASAIDIVSITAATSAHKMFFNLMSDSMNISANDTQNEMSQTVPSTTEGGNLEILFNIDLIIPILKCLDGEVIIESHTGNNSVKIHDSRENGPLYVVMPLTC